MKGIFISLIIVSYIMLSLYRRFKRTLDNSAQTDTVGDEAYDDQVDHDEPSFAYEESAEPSSPYFSYEYETTEPVVKKAPIVEPQLQVDTAPQRNRFDLRQAVIYQTVLNNHYIEEIN